MALHTGILDKDYHLYCCSAAEDWGIHHIPWGLRDPSNNQTYLGAFHSYRGWFGLYFILHLSDIKYSMLVMMTKQGASTCGLLCHVGAPQDNPAPWMHLAKHKTRSMQQLVDNCMPSIPSVLKYFSFWLFQNTCHSSFSTYILKQRE
jgi:hypothetical protein